MRDNTFVDRNIRQGYQYDIAMDWWSSCPDITYFLYWRDRDCGAGRPCSHRIAKSDIKLYIKYKTRYDTN